MKLHASLHLHASIALILPLAHALVPLGASQLLPHPLPTRQPELEPDLKDVTTLYVYVTAASTAPSITTLASNTFITVTTPAPVSPPPTPNTVIYTTTEYWSIRIWPPWLYRTTQTAVPTAVLVPSSGSREGT